MRLKKLVIQGFKSFADRLSIDFDVPLIAIVGPNGCGKSNIVDALRWVLGEQSAKSMRGEKMQDVLFAGTEKRKPLNLSEVSVTLSDVAGALRIEYDEVTITRRLYRDGTSEYLLNRQPIRLKDLQNLLLDSGIGKNAFSFFAQGQLDEVILLSPQERRRFFDETAGIGRFLLQKKEAQKKFDQLQELTLRLKDRHAEAEKQAKHLKKQAAQARVYQENVENLNLLEKALLFARWQGFSSKEKQGEGRSQKLQEQIQVVQEALAAFEKRLKQVKEGVESKETELASQQEAFYQVQSHTKIKRAENERLQTLLHDLHEREKKLSTEVDELVQNRQSHLQEVKKKEEYLQVLHKEREEAEKVWKTSAEKVQALEIEWVKLQEELKQCHEQRVEFIQKESSLSSQCQEKRLRLEDQKERKRRLEQQIKEESSSLTSFQSQLTQKKEKVEALSKEIDLLQADLESIKKQLLEIKQALQEGQKRLAELHREYAEIAARENALLQLKEHAEGFSEGTKKLLKETQNVKSPLYGLLKPLFECLTPKKGQEKAFSVLLQNYSQTLVVQTLDDLQTVTAFAQEKKWKDYSLVCLEKMEKKASKAGLQTISEESSGLAHRLFSNVNVEEEFSLSWLEESCEVVSPAGWHLDNKGTLFCVDMQGGARNVFMREVELKFLTEKKEELKTVLKQHEALLAQNATKESQLAEQLKKKEEERRKSEMVLVQENFALQRLLQDQQQAEQKKASFFLEKEKIEKASEEFAKVAEKLESELAALKSLSAGIEKSLNEKEKHFSSRQMALGAARQEHQQKESAWKKIQAECHRLRHEIQLLETRDQESQKLQTRHVEERKANQEKIQELQRRMTSLQADEKALKIEWEEKQRSQNAVQEDLQKWKQEREAVEAKIEEQRQQLTRIEKEKHVYEVSLAEETTGRKAIERELKERFDFNIEEQQIPAFELLEGSVEATEKRIRSLKHEIEKAGPVNMTSIEEYQQQEAEFLDLDKQLQDLDKSRKEVEKIISKLESESRKIFKTTFETIRGHFQKNFQILFRGGEADLHFTDSQDVLEAGIDIMARPPGKQMRSISLLSGGEKCLTALALLFALFEVKPAPFCVLDEVDAPLDEANVERFTQMLKQYIHQTQFLIVTHNKKTMAVADLLLGVSMEEKGVSKLISLAFDHEKEASLETVEVSA